MVTRLVHYSAQPLALETRTYMQPGPKDDQLWFSKPNGLWVSAGEGEDDWPSWCQGEGFGLERLKFANEVKLASRANLLRLDGARAIDAFTARYGATPKTPAMLTSVFPDGEKAIDWSRVAAEYQGIVIAPYVWSRRLHTYTRWYYGWDCAAGCIWDVSAIERIVTVRRAQEATL